MIDAATALRSTRTGIPHQGMFEAVARIWAAVAEQQLGLAKLIEAHA